MLADTEERRRQAEKAIDSIAGLLENWNHNGAPPIPPDVIERARRVLSGLPRIPAITPTAMPGIQMDYNDKDAGYIEFGLLENGTAEMYFRDRSKPKGAASVVADDEAPDLVRKFYEHAVPTTYAEIMRGR